MTRPDISAWFFDFDGVLAESVDMKTRAFAVLYEPHGPEVVEKVIAHHLLHGGLSRFEKFRFYQREFLGSNLTPEEEVVLGERFSEMVEGLVCESEWVPGARELLDANFGKTSMFVVSGTPEAELRRIVHRRGMMRYFDGVLGSPRTKGELISVVVADRGFDPRRCIMVGDSISDYAGAMEAGVGFVGRIAAGVKNPFPQGTRTVADLSFLVEERGGIAVARQP